MSKKRYQNPVLQDTIDLEFYSYQNNELVDVYSIQKVEIYYLDKFSITKNNLDGRVLKTTISGTTGIIKTATGVNQVSFLLDDNIYELGNFIDIWYIKFSSSDINFTSVVQQFKIFPNLIETRGAPFVYTPTFTMSPKKIVKGGKQMLKIGFDINVPFDSQILDQFYFNIQTTGNLFLRIEQFEGCGFNSKNKLSNVKTNPEWEPVNIRGDGEAYFLIDATETNTGIYDLGLYWIQFKILIDGQDIISPKFTLQIFD